MSISVEQVRWVANLARLELSEGDLATMTQHLSAILDYVDQLKDVPTDGVEPLAHPLDIRNVFRADEPAPSLPADEALASAAKRQGEFFGVPAVLD